MIKVQNVAPPKVFDNPLAWVCSAFDESGTIEFELKRSGLSREEIIKAFPPGRGSQGLDFDRKGLIKAIIYEAWREVVEFGEIRERANVRSFWYERLMYTLIKVMGEPGDEANICSLNGSINDAWAELIELNYVTYEELNIYSEKESSYKVGVSENSPYPTTIVIVEKASLFEELSDIADVYQISFCATGGNSSRAAAIDLTNRLERMGVDLDQDFTVYSFYDLDPEGWAIPETFCNHLRLQVRGNIELIRLGLLKEQLGKSVISRAIPYSLKAKTEKGTRGKVTKFENFEEFGVYATNAKGELVPGRIELNIFKPSQIRDRILKGLAEHLDGFEFLKDEIKRSIESDLEDLEQFEFYDDIWNEINEVYKPYHDRIQKAIDATDELISFDGLEQKQELGEVFESRDGEIAELERLEQEEIDKIKQKYSRAKSGVYDAYSDRVWELQQSIKNEEEFHRDQRATLSDLEDYVTKKQDEHSTEIENEDVGFASYDDLIELVEEDWQGWLNELGIEPPTRGDFIKSGEQKQKFEPTLSWEDSKSIKGWVRKNYCEDYIAIGECLIDYKPDELVDKVLGGEIDLYSLE